MKKEIDDINKLVITKTEAIPFRYMTQEEEARAKILSNKTFFKEKYRNALKISTQIELYKYAQSNPEWIAKDVLIAILKGYNSQLPSIILVEMAQFIVTEWETIHASKSEIVHV